MALTSSNHQVKRASSALLCLLVDGTAEAARRRERAERLEAAVGFERRAQAVCVAAGKGVTLCAMDLYWLSNKIVWDAICLGLLKASYVTYPKTYS